MKNKAEYRIRIEPNCDWGVAYFVEKRKHFLGIGYWSKMCKNGMSGRYTIFKYKSAAEELIEQYKNGEKKELEYLGDINEELKEENKKLKEKIAEYENLPF